MIKHVIQQLTSLSQAAFMLFSDARRSVEGLSKALKGQRGVGGKGCRHTFFTKAFRLKPDFTLSAIS